jgi:hypothetical protein
MRRLFGPVRAFVAAMLVLGFAAEVHAGGLSGLRLQRRGRTGFVMPSKPVTVDSSPTIETLNKALKALGSTDRDYDGHREKAINHIGMAIRHMETPNARGKSNAALDKASTGTAPVATKTATTLQAASDEYLRKAKAILFVVHHQLKDHAVSKGQLRADADVLIAITEISNALQPPKTPPATAATTTTKPAAPATSKAAK